MLFPGTATPQRQWPGERDAAARRRGSIPARNLIRPARKQAGANGHPCRSARHPPSPARKPHALRATAHGLRPRGERAHARAESACDSRVMPCARLSRVAGKPHPLAPATRSTLPASGIGLRARCCGSRSALRRLLTFHRRPAVVRKALPAKLPMRERFHERKTGAPALASPSPGRGWWSTAGRGFQSHLAVGLRRASPSARPIPSGAAKVVDAMGLIDRHGARPCAWRPEALQAGLQRWHGWYHP